MRGDGPPRFRRAGFVPDYLPEFFTWWDDITPEQVEAYSKCLDTAQRERDLQELFERHPLLLIQHLGGGHGRWVIPQKRLGAEFVTDFLVGEKHSFGFEWQAIELESPRAKLFNKAGDPSKELNHAIRQITDWRAWIKRNLDYATRPPEQQGLGLIDIDASVKGLILIGRAHELKPETNDRRRQMVQDSNIVIHTYDWVRRTSLGRIEALRRSALAKSKNP